MEGESRQAAVKRELEQTSRQLEDTLVALSRLKWVSEEAAFALIRRVRAAEDPMDELCRATQQIAHTSGLSEHRADMAVLPTTRTKMAFELSRSHNNSYPILLPVDSAGIGISTPSLEPYIQ